MSPDSIRLIIADDHPVVLAGLRTLFEEEQGFEVLASCSDGEDALAAIERHAPDVAILDLRMPRRNGLEVLRALKDSKSPCRALILAAAIRDEELLEAMQLGVKGVVLKEMAPAMLLRAVRKVHAGGQWLEKESLGRAIDRMLNRAETLQSLQLLLTERELEIMRIAASGKGNQAIATALHIAPGTVKTHLHSIYSKLGVEGRVGLMVYAKERSLV
ncbi:MAG: response regulator transcription factor [Thermoanaerobaculia bacterium]|jgi:DNA-binding NarL/FixJ family response regulator